MLIKPSQIFNNKGQRFLCRGGSVDQIEELREIIEKLRLRLHKTSHGKCFCDPEIVKVSQELNEVLNKYDNLIRQKCK